MKIYTKTGDTGETSLFGGQRLSKSNLRIESYGTVDELNAMLGVVRSLAPTPEIDVLVEEIQQHLFVIGAELASPQGSVQGLPPTGAAQVEHVEGALDVDPHRLDRGGP